MPSELFQLFANPWQPALVFALVLARLAGVMLTAPVFSSVAAPWHVRALVTLALALVITPVQLASGPDASDGLPALVVPLVGELVLGLSLGFGVSLILAGVQMAGQLAAQAGGQTWGEVFSPELGENVAPFGQLFHLAAIAVYLAIGGHRLLIGGLLASFETIPPGSAGLATEAIPFLSELMNLSFALALRGAAPALAASLLAAVLLGLVGRAMPQLGLWAVGLPSQAIATLAVLGATLAGATWLMTDSLPAALELVEHVGL
jgi:flagellar biosynthetic protein FliR